MSIFMDSSRISPMMLSGLGFDRRFASTCAPFRGWGEPEFVALGTDVGKMEWQCDIHVLIWYYSIYIYTHSQVSPTRSEDSCHVSTLCTCLMFVAGFSMWNPSQDPEKMGDFGHFQGPSWMFWWRKAGRCQRCWSYKQVAKGLWIPPVIPGGGSRYILRFVSAWVQKWFDLNTDAWLPGVCVDPVFIQFNHSSTNIFNQHIFARQEESWTRQLYGNSWVLWCSPVVAETSVFKPKKGHSDTEKWPPTHVQKGFSPGFWPLVHWWCGGGVCLGRISDVWLHKMRTFVQC